MSDSIEVHVLGGKKGESIVVRLPGDQWGVVDNYTPNLRRPDSNPTLQFLKKRGVTRLSFLCLTHPHDDHYKGMSHLLEAFRPDRVWIFGSATHRYLHEKVAEILQAGAHSKHVDADDLENTDELVRILDLIQEQYADKKRNPRLEVLRLQLGLPLFEINSTPPVRVVSIGASGGRALQYESTLADCFDTGGRFLADRLPSVNHNMISGGLLIEYGQARIILGGDIDEEAWAETMLKFAKSDLNCKLVKVSHHGSVTGYCNGLWQKLSPGKSAVAVITPYSSQGLPSPKGLAHISENARLTLTTSLPGAALANDWRDKANDTNFQGLSADALVTLRAIFPKASNRSERLEGICSCSVSHDGTISHTVSGEAGSLSGH